MSEPGGIETGDVKTPISEVEPIEKSRNQLIRTKDEINDFVEAPLIPACEKLWDLNVQTHSSSANAKDTETGAYLILDFDSLSDENKQIAKQEGKLLEDWDGRRAIEIKKPLGDDTAREFKESVQRFQKQKATWVPSYTLAELNYAYTQQEGTMEFGVDDFKGEGYYYDPETEKFYDSEELCKKAKDDVSVGQSPQQEISDTKRTQEIEEVREELREIK